MALPQAIAILILLSLSSEAFFFEGGEYLLPPPPASRSPFGDSLKRRSGRGIGFSQQEVDYARRMREEDRLRILNGGSGSHGVVPFDKIGFSCSLNNEDSRMSCTCNNTEAVKQNSLRYFRHIIVHFA